jgi:poly-gamma-glutamate synthesis protein (capsule biosynthesis protein)
MRKSILTFSLSLISIFVFAQDTTRLSLLFFGDIMQHDSQITDAYDRTTKTYNYDPCFQFVKPYLQAADLAIGNLELTLAGPPYKGYPQFSAPDALLTTLKNSGVDVLVTANNHCVDTGRKGLERTLLMLDSLNIPRTGTFSDDVDKLNNHPLIVNKNGFKLAILNYTFSTNGLPVTKPNIVNMIDTASMRKDLVKAKSMTPDAIIVFTHWGIEYQSLPSKWQKDVTEFSFKHGAQLVIGAHPHVLQPMEWRKEKNQLIAYSLGNFVSGQRKRYTDGGAMISLSLEKVTFNDNSSLTNIVDPKYTLEWVYRTVDAEKNYYILPVAEFEKDTTRFIKDQESKSAFKLYAEDSRALYGKHNRNIPEDKEIASDSLITYKVHYLTIGPTSDRQTTLPTVPYGSEKVVENLMEDYYSGEFLDPKAAEKYRKKLIALGHRATVVKFVNGKKAQD